MSREFLRGNRLSPRKRWKGKLIWESLGELHACILMVLLGVDSRLGCELKKKQQISYKMEKSGKASLVL